jgi:hypothetical protein
MNRKQSIGGESKAESNATHRAMAEGSNTTKTIFLQNRTAKTLFFKLSSSASFNKGWWTFTVNCLGTLPEFKLKLLNFFKW